VRQLGIALAALAAAAVLTGAASAKELQASLGSVAATVTWRPAAGGLTARDVQLTVTRAGVTVLDGPVTIDGKKTMDVPTNLRVVDLVGDGEPEILLDLYTGGAHCCTVSLVERFDSVAATYQQTVHDWGDPGYRLRNLDGSGTPEFVTGDDRFAYAFACYACSALPIQIWRFEPSGFQNVTRQFPSLVRKDATAVWNDYRRAHRRGQDVRGILSAWAADRALLGKAAGAFARLRRLAARGILDGDPPWPSGQRYVRDLRRSLRAWGYL
jgi:hypothetical protein